MHPDIFCPNTHLIFDAPRCPVCNWERPLPQDIGSLLWGPVQLAGGLGGPGSGVFALPAITQGVLVLPQRNAELIGLDVNSGEILWRSALEAGRMIRALVADGTRFLASISDERPLGQSGNGRLVSVDARTGEIETLWQADSHQLTTPLLIAEQIVLRTSTGGLFALSRSPQPEPIWQQPLDAWWSLTPFVAEDILIVSDGRPMHGEGYLVAFSLSQGQCLWKVDTAGMLAQPPAACAQVVAFLENRQRLVAVDLYSGERIWQQEFRKIYCPPLADGKRFYLIVRGDESTPQAGRYQLRALQPQSGALVWQTALPARARLLSLSPQTLYAASDDGRVLAYDLDQGRLLWETPISSKSDPIHTELLLLDGNLFAGTYDGRVFAVRAAAAYPLETGEDERSQAISLALHGDFKQAAEIFVKLQQPEKAFALYEHGNHYQAAGDLADRLGLNKEASEYYEFAGNQLAQAQSREKMGDLLGAAELFEPAGQEKHAAQLFEQGGAYRKALEIYKRIGKIGDFIRLVGKVTIMPGDLDAIESKGTPEEVGRLALQVGAFARAVKIFEKLEDRERELEALLQLAQESPDEWVWSRMSEVARRLGKFQYEAQAWEKLQRPRKAATAYHRAAQQAERIDAHNEAAIAHLYECAQHFYDDLGMQDECQECQSKIIYYRSLPFVIVEGQTSKAFKEGEFNLLELRVSNIGRGVARNVRVQVGVERFEIDETATSALLKNISAGGQRMVKISLRPYQEQVGDAVPLVVEWFWEDAVGNTHHETSTTYVAVKSKDSASTGGPPQQVENHYHGTVYKVEGDQIQGDKLDGSAQKGDKVEIHRGQGVKLTADERACPTCYLPVDPDKKFCEACGTKLKADS